ncbi:MAG TPA: cation diffusion facilitator family transporter, partial [Thermodesulfobacteriota bacterium]|nr:cation diffusion facilitator family transporter [Thermodesulfobacteriota bacterium]
MFEIKRGEKIAAIAIVITACLALVKGLAGYFCQSSALFADAFHSGADVLAIFASWLGLKLVQKEATRKFPFGYYKAETLAALFISLLIVFAGWEMLMEGYHKFFIISHLRFPIIGMVVSLISSLISLFLFSIEKRAGNKINSQSLRASADEQRIDVVSSLVVFISIGMTAWKIPYIEGVVIILIAFLIFKIGFQNGMRAVYGLMDANLHPELETDIKDLIIMTPEVTDLSRLKIRQAGPFVFAEATIKVKKSANIVRAHTISEIVEKKVKERLPIVESVIVHVEPYRSSNRRILIPTEEEKGFESEVSNHFGRAPYFAFVDVEGDQILSTTFKENAFRNKKIHAGLSAANHVVKDQIDALVTQKLGEISFYTLRDHLVELFFTRGKTLQEVIKHYLTDSLKPLTHPTHSSEKAGEDLISETNEAGVGLRGRGMRKRYQLGRLASIGKGGFKEKNER